MGRKNVLKSYKLFDQEDISVSATSETTSVINLDKASIILAWTGTAPVGEVVVEARNGDKDAWVPLEIATMAVTGNSGNHRILFLELPFTDIRLQYTATSGTGTMDATITAKVVGA